ncbi:transposable element Tcb2 transposase [Trichonephila clavipes]|nr:transposable element Tcb2 transposase [Trichonephila clavipes]
MGPFLNGLPGTIFQQVNARPHTARVDQDFLRHFQALPWPTRSPYLSPVEHVWDQLKRQMPSCHSVHDLELAVQDLWAHLPQDNIRCPINSMLNHVAACIATSGIFEVKDAPRTDRPVVENVDKITELIEVDRHVSSRSIARKLKIDHKTVLSQSWIQKEAPYLGTTPNNTKKHDGSNFHLRSLGQTE